MESTLERTREGYLQGVPGLTAEPVWNTRGYYDVKFSLDEHIIPMTMDEVGQKLRVGDPPIIFQGDIFKTRCLEVGELLLVARHLRQFFGTKECSERSGTYRRVLCSGQCV